MPAPGQGILALIARQDNRKVLELLRTIEDPPTRGQADAERELVNVLEGGCKVPIGALASSTETVFTSEDAYCRMTERRSLNRKALETSRKQRGLGEKWLKS